MSQLKDYLTHYRMKIERGVDDEKKLYIIRKLRNVRVTKEVLLDSGIAKIVKQLGKEGGEVGDESTKLLKIWKDLIYKNVPETKPPINGKDAGKDRKRVHVAISNGQNTDASHEQVKKKSKYDDDYLDKQNSYSSDKAHSKYDSERKNVDRNGYSVDHETSWQNGIDPPEYIPTSNCSSIPAYSEAYDPSKPEMCTYQEYNPTPITVDMTFSKSNGYSSDHEDEPYSSQSHEEVRHTKSEKIESKLKRVEVKSKLLNGDDDSLFSNPDKLTHHKKPKKPSEPNTKQSSHPKEKKLHKSDTSGHTDSTKKAKPIKDKHVEKHKTKNESPIKPIKKKIKVPDAEVFTASEATFEDCLGLNDVVSFKKKKTAKLLKTKQTVVEKTFKEKPSPVKDKVVSTDKEKFLDKANSKSSSHDKVKSSSHDKVKSSSHDKLKASSHDKVKSSSHDKVKSSSHDKLKSSSHDKVKSSSHDKVKSSSHDKVKSSSHDKVKSSSRDKVKSKSSSRDKVKSKSLPEDHANSKSSEKNSKEKLEVVPRELQTKPKPITISEEDIRVTLPEISTNYRPLPRIDYENSQHSRKTLGNEEAMFISSKKDRTAVYSGRKNYFLTEVPTLFNRCIQILIDNVMCIEYTGGVPYMVLKPVLEHCTATVLYRLEDFNPYLLDDTHELWERHCLRDFRNHKPEEGETWRDMYLRIIDEREKKLERLTSNIKGSISSSNPVRRAKLAYIDSFVKPPRDVARKQAKYGTAHAVNHTAVKPPSPSKPVAKAASPIVKHEMPERPTPAPAMSKKPAKPAPLMAKTLKAMKQAYRR